MVDVFDRLAPSLSDLRGAWERAPLLSTGLDSFDDVFSAAQVDRLLHSGLPASAVRVVVGGRTLPRSRYARRRERGGDANEPVVDAALVCEHLAAGATVILEELRTFCPEVRRFAAQVEAATGYDVYCAAFITPRGHPGVPLHYDTVSVFMRQVSGSKRWRISPPVTRWPHREWHGSTPLPDQPVLDTVLRPGSCLYVPRGFGHAGEATDEHSIHISFGLRPPTWATFLLDALTKVVWQEERLREALPPRFAAADLEALVVERRGLLAKLVETLPVPAAPTAPVLAPRATGALLAFLSDGDRAGPVADHGGES